MTTEEELFKEDDPLELLLLRATSYCARAEKAPAEVEKKLWQWGEGAVDNAMVDEVMRYLRMENYISEERYARLYISDKLRFLKKGPLLLRQELRQKGISDEVISEALSEINREEWCGALSDDLSKRIEGYRQKAKNSYDLRGRLLAAAYRRGYGMDLAESVIGQLDLTVEGGDGDEWDY